jgi:hypothetical protein
MLVRPRFFSGFLAVLALVLTFGSPVTASAADVPTITWTQLSPATSPTPREGPAMTYDPVSHKTVLFGGLGPGVGYLADTWTFDGTTWTQEITPVAPPVRVAATMAFDRVTRQVVLFGGYDGHNYLGDTWLWDGATSTWTQAHPQQSPIPATGPNAFTDPLNGHVDVFGGFDGRFYDLDTWRWTGSNWNHLNPANQPSARAAAAVAFDGSRKYVVLFAGLGDVNPHNTWTWDGTDWTEQSPPTQPPNRYDSAAAFDPRLGAVVVFGGGAGGEDLRDSWAWTGVNWKPLFPTQSPPRREAFGMAYDAATGHVVIFGGVADSKVYGDTWQLDPK